MSKRRVVETGGPNKDGHMVMAEYLAPRGGISTQEAHAQITTDPEVFEGSLEIMYNEKYANTTDYQTFRQRYIQKHGDPFQTEDVVPQDVNAAVKQQSSSVYDFKWGANNSETLETPNVATRAPLEEPSDNRVTRSREEIGDEIAYTGLMQRRGDDFESNSDDMALAEEKNLADLLIRINQPTPLEFVRGAEPGYKEFNYRMAAIQDEVANIDRSLNHLSRQLKSEYGDDFYERLGEDVDLQTAVEGDPRFQDAVKLQGLYNKNVDRAVELMSDDRFKFATSYQNTLEDIQKQKDIEHITSSGPARLFEATQDLALRSVGKLVQSLGAVGEATETSLKGGGTHSPSDALWTFLQDAGQGFIDTNPMASRNSRPAFTNTAVYRPYVNGPAYQVDFKDGEVQAIRDKSGYLTDNPFSEQQMADIKNLKPKSQFNSTPLFYKTADVLTDLGIQVALTKGTTGFLTKTGATKTIAGRVGVTASTAGTMMGPLLQEGKELFPADPQKAALYALSAATGIGLSANLFGLESRLAGGPGGILDKVSRAQFAKLKNFAKGRNSARGAINVGAAKAVDLGVAGLGEMAEETILEGLIKGAAKLTLNTQKSDAIDWDEVKETAAISFVVGMLGGGATVMPEIRESGLWLAAQNSDKYAALLGKYIDNGVIPFDKKDPEFEQKKERFIANQRSDLDRIASSVEMVLQNNPEANPSKLAGLFEAKIKAEKGKEKAEVLGLQEEIQRREVDEAILNKEVQKEINDGSAIPAHEINPENIYDLIPIDKPGEPDSEQKTLDEVIGQPGELRGFSGYIDKLDDGNYYVVGEESVEQISKENASVSDLPVNIAPEMEVEIKKASAEGSDVYVINDEELTIGEVIMGGPEENVPMAVEILNEQGDVDRIIRDSRIANKVKDDREFTTEEDSDLPKDSTEDRTEQLLPVIQAKTPKSIAKAAKQNPVTRRAGQQLDRLIERAEEGDSRAEELIPQQVEKIQQEVRDLVEYDETEQRRLDIPGFDQKSFDEDLSEVSEIQKAKGLDETVSNQIGLPPGEGFVIDDKRQEAVQAEMNPGSPLDPNWNQFKEGYSGKTTSDLERLHNDISLHIDQTNKAIRLIERGLIEGDVGPLLGKVSALKKKRKQVKKNLQALRASGMDSIDDLTGKVTRNGTSDINIDENSISFPLGEKFINFLYGLVGGKTGIEFDILAKKFKNIWKKNTVGLLPGDVLRFDIDRVNEIQSHTQKANVISNQLKKQLKKEGIDFNDSAVLQELDGMLKAPDSADTLAGEEVSEEILGIIEQMRNHIDQLSVMLIQSGLTDGPLMDVLSENLGVYLHRSYQIHNDPDWIEKVQKDADIWNPGLAWWNNQLDARKSEVNLELQEVIQDIAKQEAKLDQLDSGTSPRTVEKIIRKKDGLESEKLRLEEVLDVIDSKIEAPSASLVAMLKDQMRTGSSASKGLGAKDEGILKMRGGQAKKDAVNEAKRNLKVARKAYQQAEKELNRADKLETTKKVDKAFQTAEQAWEELQRAQGELDAAFDMDIPEEIRKLFGEYEGAMTNYMMTVFKQTSLATNHKFLTNVRKQGLQDGWLRENNDPTKGYETLIAAEENSVMAPLNGLRTSDDIAEAFNDFNKAYESIPLISQMIYLSGLTKKWLTVYSHVGHVRNIVSGGYFHTMAGDLSASPAGVLMYANGILESIGAVIPGANYLKNSVIGPAMQKAAKAVMDSDKTPQWISDQFAIADDLKEANKQAFRVGRDYKGDELDIELYQEFVALGLTDESVTFGLIQDALKEFKEGMTSPLSNVRPTPNKRISQDQKNKRDDVTRALIAGREAGKSADKFAQGTYQASDTAHRVLRYMRELRRYASSRDIDMSRLTPGSIDPEVIALKQEVADITRKIYPTYSLMPKIISTLGKSPVIGPFISFHWTAGYAGVTNIAQGIQDIKSGDTGVGVSRFLGVALANGIYSSVLGTVGAGIVGGLLGLTTGEEEDEDTDNHKWTFFLPSWSKYSKVSVFPMENGEFAYIDHGSQVPNVAVYEAMTSALKGDFERSTEVFSKEVLGPFVATEVFGKSVLEAAFNTKELGKERPIYETEAPLFDKVYEGTAHVLDRIKPGVLTTAQRLIVGYNNYVGDPNYEDFKNYNLGIEVMNAATGLRVSKGDVATSFGINLFMLNKQMYEGLNIYRRKARNLKRNFENLPKRAREKKLKESLIEAELLAKKSVEKMIALYTAAKATNISRRELDELLKKSNLPKATRQGLKRGRVVLPDIDNIED